MAVVLDADTHIAEPPEMWDFLDPEWYPRRPVVVQVPEDTLYGSTDHMWLIDGQIFPEGGGMLIRDRDGEVIGAVGVTGDRQERDQELAAFGIRAAGLKTDEDCGDLDVPVRLEN